MRKSSRRQNSGELTKAGKKADGQANGKMRIWESDANGRERAKLGKIHHFWKWYKIKSNCDNQH